MILKHLAVTLFLLCLIGMTGPSVTAQENPNIVYIMCDDLGYGDVQCLNPEHGKIKTPHMDSLAADGMTFLDAHSGSSVCTPTRYGLLTGRYSWRTRLQKGVVSGFAPCVIAKDRPTVASFLKSQNYHTAIVGKWHLNCQYLNPKTGEAYSGKEHKMTAPIDATIPDGPLHRGFDYFHGIHHARSMKAIIENDRVIAHDDVVNFLPRCETKAVEYIESRKGTDQPFFLYVPLGSPHTPIVPTDEWKGKSGIGEYGDFVMQTDHVVGQILKAIQTNGFKENTLVFFTSDNGCSKAAGIGKLATQGHKVSAHLRGSKADIWDGGHRVAFFARWPGRIKPGSKCNELICHTDLLATLAEILGTPMPVGSGEDSVSILPAFSQKPIVSTRAGVVHHSFSGHFAYRSGKWKLALARSSGGWSSPKENDKSVAGVEAQLYDMTADVGEQVNLFDKEKVVADRLLAQLTDDVYSGRSTDGPESPNDVGPDVIKLWKSKDNAAKKKKGKKSSKQTDKGSGK